MKPAITIAAIVGLAGFCVGADAGAPQAGSARATHAAEAPESGPAAGAGAEAPVPAAGAPRPEGFRVVVSESYPLKRLILWLAAISCALWVALAKAPGTSARAD